MADPVPTTWTLLECFERRIAGISRDAGYFTDLGSNVTREPYQQDADLVDTYTAIVLVEESAPFEAAVSRTHSAVTVAVVPMTKHGSDRAQEYLHRCIADIKRCMKDAQRDFPPRIQFPRFAGTRPIPPVEGMAWIGAEVRFTTHVPLT